MTPKVARHRLAVLFHAGEDARTAEFRNAEKALASSEDLRADFEHQKVVDRRISEGLRAVSVPDDVLAEFRGEEERLRLMWSKKAGHKPAILSVIVGFLLLVGLLTWHFLQAGDAFPEEALSIASEGARLRVEQFEVVEQPAGSLADWFLLKGFERFHVPEQFAKYEVVGARIFKIEGQPVAVLAVPENFMFFMVFDPKPFGIKSGDEGKWRTQSFDINHAAAIRFDQGMCFMVVIKGTPADLVRLLGGGTIARL